MGKCRYIRASQDHDGPRNEVREMLEHPDDEALRTHLELASSLYAEAMSTADWETAERGIRRARECLDTLDEHLLRSPFDTFPQSVGQQRQELRSAVDRASALLRVELAKSL